ncbi:MAG: hypothetical protein LBH44_10765 [Treponema sp.]|nr:hypothetical protein [Treponema sp.]
MKEEAIFIKTEKELYDIAKELFTLVGVKKFYEHDNSAYINDQYYRGKINRKITMSIALNNYDYEDDFNMFIMLDIEGKYEKSNFCDDFCNKLSNYLNQIVAKENDEMNALIYFYPKTAY